MNGYSWIAVFSIFCYLFLLLTFLVSKPKEKALRSFSLLLGIMLLWNGGSLGMRIELWPNVNFWHHVSLLGMMMVAYGYYQFVLAFLDETNSHGRKFWMFFYLALFVFNCLTNFFIPLPEVIRTGDTPTFLYHYNWHIYFLFALIVPTLAQMCILAWRHCRGNHIALRQLTPVMGGLAVLVMGHLLTTLPMFIGLPMDMLSGVCNAIFLFYALYRKRLFRMTILLSKSNYIIISAVIGLAIFSDLALVLQRFLMQNVGLGYTSTLMIIAVFLFLLIGLLYLAINSLCDAIFSRKDQKRNNALNHFSENLSHMMSVSEILQSMTNTAQEVFDIDRLFVLVRDSGGTYRIEHTLNPLEEKSFSFDATHPLVKYLKE